MKIALYKILLSTCLLASLSLTTFSQTATFESLPLGPDTAYVNFSNPMTDVGFTNGQIHFPCYYDTAWGGFWSKGFAYSNKTDSVQGGYGNQYSARPGKGAGGSAKYAVAYGQLNGVRIPNSGPFPLPFYWDSISLTNSTYAYNSMKYGDGFAKKFGGTTGTDPDYLKLIIASYQTSMQSITDTIEVYLADYRFADSTQDYILSTWKNVSLRGIPGDSLVFYLSSSDTGQFGMNTPAYFCIDNLKFLFFGSTGEDQKIKPATLYPNPTTQYLKIDFAGSNGTTHYEVYNATGALVSSDRVTQSSVTIDVRTWPPGTYYLFAKGKSTYKASFVKHE